MLVTENELCFELKLKIERKLNIFSVALKNAPIPDFEIIISFKFKTNCFASQTLKFD